MHLNVAVSRKDLPTILRTMLRNKRDDKAYRTFIGAVILSDRCPKAPRLEFDISKLLDFITVLKQQHQTLLDILVRVCVSDMFT